MTKKAKTLEPVPKTGGSYRRNKDGSLTRLDTPQKPWPGKREAQRMADAQRKADSKADAKPNAEAEPEASSAGKSGKNKE